ncbi:hypothetical protein MACJ_002717 [Theileria orientalis]|uniref:Uncharacterized protein n=1 Tax=Theileria orientalis TaxID=68886 RepID=A0A976M6P2_THEOR|nr:hypothetical protein MACJ_002717 [Theileria orientalis]
MLNLFLLISLLIANNSFCVKYVTLDVCQSNTQHFLTESSKVGGRPCTYHIPRGGVITTAVTYGNQSIWEPFYEGEIMGYLRFSHGESPVILVSSSVKSRKILKYYNMFEGVWVMFKEFDSLKNKQAREKGLEEKTYSENAGELLDNSAHGDESNEDARTPEEVKTAVSTMFSMATQAEDTQVKDTNQEDMEIDENKSDTGKSYGLLRSLTPRIDLRDFVKKHMEDNSESSDTEESLTFSNNELIIALEEFKETEAKRNEGDVGNEKNNYQAKKTPCTSRWDIKGAKDLDFNKVLTDLDVLQTFQVLITEEKARIENSLGCIQEESEQDLIDYENDFPDDFDESVYVQGIFLEVCKCNDCKKKGYKELHFVGHSDKDPPDVEKIEPSLGFVQVPTQYPGPQESEEKSLQVSINPETFPQISGILNSMTIEDVEPEVKKGQNSEVFYDIFKENFDPSKFAASLEYQDTELSVSDSDDSDEKDFELIEEQIDFLIDSLYPNLKHILTKTRTNNSQNSRQVEDANNAEVALTPMALSSDDDSDSEDDDKDSRDPIPMPTDIEPGPKQELQDSCFVDSNEKSSQVSETLNQSQVLYPKVIVVNGPTRPVPRPRSIPVPYPRTKFLKNLPDFETELKHSKSTDDIQTNSNDQQPSQVTQTEEGPPSQIQPDDSSAIAGNRALKLFSDDSDDDSDMTNPPRTILGQFLLEQPPDNYPSKKDLESADTESHHTLSEYAILKSKEPKNRALKNVKTFFRGFFTRISRSVSKHSSDKSKKSSRKRASSKDSKPQETDTEVSGGDKKDPEGATSEITKPSGSSVPTNKDLGARPKQQPPPKPPRSRLSQIIGEETFSIQLGDRDFVKYKDPDDTEDPTKDRKRRSTREEEKLQRMETTIKKHHLIFLRQRYIEEKERTRQKTKEIQLLTRELEQLRKELMTRHNLTDESITEASPVDESDTEVVDKVDNDTNQEKTPETAEDKEEKNDKEEEKKSKESCQPGENLEGPSNRKNDDEDDFDDIAKNFPHIHISRKKHQSCSVS